MLTQSLMYYIPPIIVILQTHTHKQLHTFTQKYNYVCIMYYVCKQYSHICWVPENVGRNLHGKLVGDNLRCVGGELGTDGRYFFKSSNHTLVYEVCMSGVFME